MSMLATRNFTAGVAQAGLAEVFGRDPNAKPTFNQFYPDAPERLRVAAWRQIQQQLRSIEAGQNGRCLSTNGFFPPKIILDPAR